MFTPNLIIGLAIMAFGVVLLLDRLGIAAAVDLLQYWPALLVLFGASVILQAFRPRDPAAPAQRSVVSPGFVLLIAILAVFFSQSVFRWDGTTTEASASGERVALFGIMGSTRGASASPAFERAQMGSVMGRSTLDLRQATIAPGQEAEVNVFVAMGRATILVPEGWEVDTSALPVMGAVEDQRWGRRATESTDPAATQSPAAAAPAIGPPPRLVLRGFVMMGKVEIES